MLGLEISCFRRHARIGDVQQRGRSWQLMSTVTLRQRRTSRMLRTESNRIHTKFAYALGLQSKT